MAAVYTDPTTGIYKDSQNNWFLKDGTPLMTFDATTGAYQESDGTWYAYDGTPLMNYVMNLNAYQESDGTWYDTNGKEVLLNSNLYKQLAAFGYNVSQNQNTSVVKKPAAPVVKKPSLLIPIIAITALSLVLVIIYKTAKK